MNWLTSVFGWFTSGSSAATKVLDAGIKGIDAIVYTDQEKAEARQKLMDAWLETQKTLQSETSVRSVTRRVIACAIIFPYVALVIAAAAVYKLDPEYAKFLILLANGQFGMMAAGVGVFYFGPYMIGRAMGRTQS